MSKSIARRPLEPTWWRKVGTGYEQQDGYGRLNRLKQRAKVTGWSLYIDGEYRGCWSRLQLAKQRAYDLTSEGCP